MDHVQNGGESGFRSVRIELFLVTPLVFDKLRIVLAIVGILLLIERVAAAAVFPVPVYVVNLCMAAFEKTPSQLGQAVGNANIDVETVQ